MLTFWPLPPPYQHFYYWASSDVLKILSLSPEIWWCHLWMDPQHKKLMQKVLMASSRNCRKENIKVPGLSLIPTRALHSKSVWVDLWWALFIRYGKKYLISTRWTILILIKTEFKYYPLFYNLKVLDLILATNQN